MASGGIERPTWMLPLGQTDNISDDVLMHGGICAQGVTWTGVGLCTVRLDKRPELVFDGGQEGAGGARDASVLDALAEDDLLDSRVQVVAANGRGAVHAEGRNAAPHEGLKVLDLVRLHNQVVVLLLLLLDIQLLYTRSANQRQVSTCAQNLLNINRLRISPCQRL